MGNVYIRGKRVDILLDTNVGRVGIELNAGYYDYLHARNLAYQCDVYAHYTLRGEEYSEETKIIQINFTYGLESNQATKNLDLNLEEQYWVQTDRNLKYVSNFLIVEFNMDKIMSFWYAKDEENIKKYKYFIMMDLNKKELEMLAGQDRMVGKYMEDIESLNESPEFHIYMTEEEDRRKRHNTEMSLARKKGLEEGIEQKSLEVAKSLLSMGVNTIEQIAKVTGLSVEAVKKLEEV